MENKKITGIILIAGNSTRFGQNINKNFEIVGEKEIVLYSVEMFNDSNYINDIIIVVKKDEKETAEKIFSKIAFKKPIKFVIGGKTRQESVYNAINNTLADIVLIHDGARPMIKQEFISSCIKNLAIVKGVAIAVKSKDTIKITDDFGIVEQTTLRKNTWVVQTPQGFYRDLLLEMHEKYKGDETVTDDCMLMERSNEKVKLIEGEYSNIKITTFDDINLMKGYLNI